MVKANQPCHNEATAPPPDVIARRLGEITLARFYAKKAVKEQLRSQGLKLQNIQASEITEAANAYLDEHRAELMAFASAQYQSFVKSGRLQRQRNRRKPSQ